MFPRFKRMRIVAGLALVLVVAVGGVGALAYLGRGSDVAASGPTAQRDSGSSTSAEGIPYRLDGKRKRFLTYAGIGILFGVANWFYLPEMLHLLFSWLEGEGWYSPRFTSPVLEDLIQWWAYLVWLLPALVVVLIEIRASRRPSLSAMGVPLSWLAAIVAYYAIYTGKLMLGLGGPQLGVRLDQGWAAYWHGVSQLRLHRMVGQDFFLYSVVAIVGGPVTGWLGGFIFLHVVRWSQRLRWARSETGD